MTMMPRRIILYLEMVRSLCCLVLIVAVSLTSVAEAYKIRDQDGCSGASSPLCCEAHDNDCIVRGARINNSTSTSCFCDSECVRLGDCCQDYRETCHAVDCVLEDHWGPYGNCDVLCGPGHKYREKRVRIQPRNGGKQCPNRRMKRRCLGRKCKVPRSFAGGHREMRETGKIIPASYGSWRKNKRYNPYKGIRGNLFNHYNPNSVQQPTKYCATYKIVSTRKSCNSTYFAEWAPRLQKGANICVECQPLAMKDDLGGRCYGHGVYGKRTRWNAVSAPGCHGEWVMREQHHKCSCSGDKLMAFILL